MEGLRRLGEDIPPSDFFLEKIEKDKVFGEPPNTAASRSAFYPTTFWERARLGRLASSILSTGLALDRLN